MMLSFERGGRVYLSYADVSCVFGVEPLCSLSWPLRDIMLHGLQLNPHIKNPEVVKIRHVGYSDILNNQAFCLLREPAAVA